MRHSHGANRGRTWLSGAIVLVLAAGCAAVAAEDARRFDAIRTQYGSRLEAAIDDQLYLSARSLETDDLDEPLARQLFPLFFLDGQVPRATDVVYLNIYDVRSKFQYQLYLDPATNAIVRQDGVEHY